MNSLKDPGSPKRRQFDPTFKREAVRNWLTSGKSAAVVAKELGLGEGRLFAWRKLLPPTDAGGKAAVGGAGGPRPPTSRPSSKSPNARSVICASSVTF